MKNIKRLVLLALLVGSLAVLMSSCSTNSTQNTNSTAQTESEVKESDAWLNNTQKVLYDEFINAMVDEATRG